MALNLLDDETAIRTQTGIRTEALDLASRQQTYPPIAISSLAATFHGVTIFP